MLKGTGPDCCTENYEMEAASRSSREASQERRRADPQELEKVVNSSAITVKCPICLQDYTLATPTKEIVITILDSTDKAKPAVSVSTEPPLSQVSKLVYTSTCKHSFCLSCMDQLLLAATANSTVNADVTSSTQIGTTTTLGSCPICRTKVSYFDLRFIHNDQPVVSMETMRKWYERDSSLPGSVYFLGTWDSTEGIIDDAANCLGKFSIHFPGISNSITTPDYVQSTINKHEILENVVGNNPYVNASGPIGTESSFISHLVHSIKLIEGRGYTLPSRMSFTNIKYFHPTRTYQGDIRPGIKSNVRFIVTFSDNMSCIARGVIIVSDVSKRYDTNVVKVLRLGGPGNKVVYRRVATNVWDTCSQLPSQSPSCSRTEPRAWSSEMLVQPTAIRPRYNPNSLWGNVFCQGYQIGLASYHFIPDGAYTNDTKISPNEAGINSSCGGYAYISYENLNASMSWPPLDNGRPIPSRVPFKNCNYDSANHTFTGSICWYDDYGTTWQGHHKWDYEMKFDSAFMTILSGVVNSIMIEDATASDTQQHLFDEVHRNTSTEMSRFGVSLIYCNAALFDHFRELRSIHHEDQVFQDVGTTENEETAGSRNVFVDSRSSSADAQLHRLTGRRSLIDDFRSRLVHEGVPFRNLTLIDHIWIVSQRIGSRNPIT